MIREDPLRLPPSPNSASDLLLQVGAGEDGWRVAKESYGALNPPPRYGRGSDPTAWGRFDTYSGRTLYAATTPVCAYDEMLASFRRLIGTIDPLTADAATVGLSVADFLAEVQGEWAEREYMHLGHVPASWRHARRLYQLAMPSSGCWIIAADKEFIAAIGINLADQLKDHDIEVVTAADLFGENRWLTLEIASWARQLVLDDGTCLWGLIYQSKHASGDCYAHWMPDTSDDPMAAPDPIQLLDSHEISLDDPALHDTARRFGLTIW